MSYSLKNIYIFCFLNLITFFFVGCGSKALPMIDEGLPYHTLGELQYSIKHKKTVTLNWNLKNTSIIEKKLDTYTLIINIFEEPIDIKHCYSCPLKFSRKTKIQLNKVIKQSKNTLFILYNDKIKHGYRYFYKLSIVSDNNSEKLESNIISFEYS